MRKVLNIKKALGIRRMERKFGYFTSLCASEDKRYLLLGFSDAVVAFDLIKNECINIVRFQETNVVSHLRFFASDTKVLIGTWSFIQSVDFPDFFINPPPISKR
jgi:hypothetical protein